MKKQMPKGILLMVAMALLIPVTALQAQIITYGGGRVSDRAIGNLIGRIETKTDTFRSEMTRVANRPDYNSYREERIDNLIDQFEAATDSLRNQFNARRDVRDEVYGVLQNAAAIDRFMNRGNFGIRAENQWMSLRNDLDTLARYNNVSWNWNNYQVPDTYGGGFGRGDFDARLTGTYRLNISQSDNVQDILDRTFGNYSMNQRQIYRPNLERRLTSPDMIAIEKTGGRVTMASTLAPQITFNADGIARSEVNDRGRSMTTSAYADRSGLTIRYQGDRANDFNLTFTPLGNGQLRVVRTLYLENQNRTVSVASVYDKVDSIARWSMVNTGDNYAGYPTDRYDRFVVPNGTRLSTRLDSNLSTRASQVGDRFTMRVTSPYQYSGAVIEGHVASTTGSGRLSGRANLSLEFDSIRMPDGRTYDFAGFVESVRPVNGDTLSVDNEGALRDRSQTTKVVTRAGIGAVIGAIVGAVAGGGKGAAIGATVGAGAGAGSVLIQGRDNIELAQGSEFVISASAPAGVGPIR